MPNKSAPEIRVLGIDPGFDRLGVAILEKVSGKERIIFSTCITTDRKAAPAERLRTIGDRVREVIAEHSPSALAIEKLFFNQNVSTALKVAEARGVVLYECARAGVEVFEYSPQEVKIAVTGYGKATKADVLRMLGLLTALPKGKKQDDELDAISLGLTHLAHSRSLSTRRAV